jgi:hypothetical protein
MNARAPASAREAGFVLVAVVVFVMALGILVLTLYGLSSYESQFFQRSVDSEQAFQSAVGGIERAKFLLCSVPPFLLQSVKQPWPAESHVLSATATQLVGGTPSPAGPVSWDDPHNLVNLRVTAEVNGVRRTVEGSFAPTAPNYYKQLVTVTDAVIVDSLAGTPPTDRSRTVALHGSVWLGSPAAGASWRDLLAPGSLVPPPLSGPVESPALQRYFADHPPSDAEPARFDNLVYRLHASQTGIPVLYCAPAGSDRDSFYRAPITAADVTVKGLALWLFPGGVRFDSPLRILGAQGEGTDDCLVMVAGPAGPLRDPEFPSAGIRFYGGIHANIPVILVSSGGVLIQRISDAATPGRIAEDLAVYAQDVRFTGTIRDSNAVVQLKHPTTGRLDGYYVDLLASQGALPNSTSAHSLALVPGSWHAAGP